MGYWHSLAKLRMHTDSSLNVFRELTRVLGDSLRFFADETCTHFKTLETPSEYQARNRATARRLAKVAVSAPPLSSIIPAPPPLIPEVPVSAGGPLPSDGTPPMATPPSLCNTVESLDVPAHTDPTPSKAMGLAASGTLGDVSTLIPATLFSSGPKSGKREKVFNLATPKAHALGDYADQIEKFGTTDSLSTKLVCFLPHPSHKYLNVSPTREKLDIAQSKDRMTEQTKMTRHHKLSRLIHAKPSTLACPSNSRHSMRLVTNLKPQILPKISFHRTTTSHRLMKKTKSTFILGLMLTKLIQHSR
jgi:hypothetical protein